MHPDNTASKKAIRFLTFYALVSSVALLLLLYQVFMKPESASTPDIIRTHGIVIEDLDGNDRILIGAPVPYSSDRVRTDSLKVVNSWGAMFPPEYMEYYKNYDHQANGMLILDAKGYDRLVFGDPVPDPNIGKRIGPSSGIVINDTLGFERSGYGILNVDGAHRVTLGLDNDNGTEGISVMILEDGTSGFFMKGEKHQVFLGKTDSSGWYTNDHLPFKGLYLKGDNNAEHIRNMRDSL